MNVRPTIAGVVVVFELCAASFLSPVRADDILVEDGFEGTLGNWTPSNGATFYTWPGSGTNYASSGVGAAQVPRTSGTQAAITLTDPLPLDTKCYTNVTISFNWVTDGGGTTVRWNLQYSSNGGTNWATLTTFNAGTITQTHYSKTLKEGTYTFSDTALFRIICLTQTPVKYFYADEMLIIGSPTPPPKGTVLVFK